MRILRNKSEVSIVNSVERELASDSFDRGELETLRGDLDNAHRAIAKLIELLATKKGLFTAEELAEFLPYDCKVIDE